MKYDKIDLGLGLAKLKARQASLAKAKEAEIEAKLLASEGKFFEAIQVVIKAKQDISLV